MKCPHLQNVYYQFSFSCDTGTHKVSREFFLKIKIPRHGMPLATSITGIGLPGLCLVRSLILVVQCPRCWHWVLTFTNKHSWKAKQWYDPPVRRVLLQGRQIWHFAIHFQTRATCFFFGIRVIHKVLPFLFPERLHCSYIYFHCSYLYNYCNYSPTLCIKCWVSAFHTEI